MPHAHARPPIYGIGCLPARLDPWPVCSLLYLRRAKLLTQYVQQADRQWHPTYLLSCFSVFLDTSDHLLRT